MLKSRISLILMTLLLVCLVQCKRKKSSLNEFDEKEKRVLEDKIIWSADEYLKWSDFVYNPSEQSYKIYAKVGISARYNVDPPIMFRSKTTFSPTESIVSDTTNINDLRVAQIKFDLLESYRRNLEIDIDSLRKLELTDLQTSDLDKLINQYYSDFEIEWNSYKPSFSDSTLDSLERLINYRLK